MSLGLAGRSFHRGLQLRDCLLFLVGGVQHFTQKHVDGR